MDLIQELKHDIAAMLAHARAGGQHVIEDFERLFGKAEALEQHVQKVTGSAQMAGAATAADSGAGAAQSTGTADAVGATESNSAAQEGSGEAQTEGTAATDSGASGAQPTTA